MTELITGAQRPITAETPRTPIEGALIAAGLRMPVFPCNPATKTPLVKDWQKVAALDTETIKNWWAAWPDAMVGAVTGKVSGIAVVDIDTKDGTSADEKAQKLEAEHGKLFPAFATRTPSGGLHFGFYIPKGIDIRNSAGKLAPCVDVRGTGGYVIFAGSVRADGKRYSFIKWEV